MKSWRIGVDKRSSEDKIKLIKNERCLAKKVYCETEY